MNQARFKTESSSYGQARLPSRCPLRLCPGGPCGGQCPCHADHAHGSRAPTAIEYNIKQRLKLLLQTTRNQRSFLVLTLKWMPRQHHKNLAGLLHGIASVQVGRSSNHLSALRALLDRAVHQLVQDNRRGPLHPEGGPAVIEYEIAVRPLPEPYSPRIVPGYQPDEGVRHFICPG